MSKHVCFPFRFFPSFLTFFLLFCLQQQWYSRAYMCKIIIIINNRWLVLNTSLNPPKKFAGAMTDTHTIAPRPWWSTRWSWSPPRTTRQSSSGFVPGCLRWLWVSSLNIQEHKNVHFSYSLQVIGVSFSFIIKRSQVCGGNLCCGETVFYRQCYLNQTMKLSLVQ